MNYFIYRYSPLSIGIRPDENLSIVCPEKFKYSYLELGFKNENTYLINDFELSDLLVFFESQTDITNIFTLDEGLMLIVGILKSIFTTDNLALKVNMAYKDKKMMRELLDGKIIQPYLLQSDKALPESFMIKPRNGASGRGVKKVSKIPKYFTSNDYILESIESFDTMLTCDGIAINGEIVYFFSHEYVGNILDINKNFYNIIKTNSKYGEPKFIERLKDMTQIVLDNLGTEDIHPFHAEFFYNSETDRLSFCEIGKRFGGGNIPFLIKSAFKIDILETFWNLVNKSVLYQQEISYPEKLAATLAIFQNGKKQEVPNIPVEFEFFRDYSYKPGIQASSLEDLRYLISFSVSSEQELKNIFKYLEPYLYEQRK